MNRATRFGLLGLLLLSTVACDKITAGNVGIKVNLLGSEKGVQTEELGPGRYWIGYNEELYVFPTFTQNYVWTAGNDEGSEGDESISFQTIEGMNVNADVGISYSIDPLKVDVIFQKYRRGVDEITDTYLRNMVKDALNNRASKLPAETVYGAGKEALMREVQADVIAQVADLGIIIERIYWISSVRLPDTMVAALNLKIEAQQRAIQRQNEVAEAKAEADKKVAEADGAARSAALAATQRAQEILGLATAQAEANRLLAESLSDEILRSNAIDRWDGVLPTYFGGNGPLPMLDVGRAAAAVAAE